MNSPRTVHDGPTGLAFDREAFRDARTRAGLTLADLAEAIGRSESGLKKLQAGHRARPSADTYRRIIARLGLPYGALWERADHDQTMEGHHDTQTVA